MNGIGIIGCGISGLQLALYLQQRGVPTTVYTPAPMSAIVEGPVQNFVTRWGPTLDRERSLGITDPAAYPATRMRLRVVGTPIEVNGAFAAPADTTDFRIYLPRLLAAYLDQGGNHQVTECGPSRLPELVRRHDLVVVAAGRDGFGNTFPLDPQRTRYRTPQRLWTVGLYDGIDQPPGADVEINVIPEAGEILHIRMRARGGPTSVVGVAALPTGPLAYLADYPHAQDLPGFTTAVLTALRTHAPAVADRVHRRGFAPTGSRDVLRGALTPTVRRPVAVIDGCPVLAIGDAWILNDPLVAQGANLGSRSAAVLGAAIAAGGPYNHAFTQQTEAALWAAAHAPTLFSNAFLAPPSPHVLHLLAQASSEAALADRFVNGFAEPEHMLTLLTPRTTPA
jgi:2-polyprenyl-6-methoxyphenol hydroxylase-like FAD-dependent oxidoreductase